MTDLEKHPKEIEAKREDELKDLMNGPLATDDRKEEIRLAKNKKGQKLDIYRQHCRGNLSGLWDVEFPPRKFFIPNIIESSRVTMLGGQSQAGKTTFLMGLALHIATGKKTQFGETEQSNVLYVDGEMGVDDYRERMLQIANAYGIIKEEVNGLYHDASREFRIEDSNCIESTRNYIINHGVGVVFLDSLVSTTSTGDIMEMDLDKFRSFCNSVTDLGAAIVTNHHFTSKKEITDPTLGTLFGRSELGWTVDWGVSLVRVKNNPNVRRLTHIKWRHIPDSEILDINIETDGTRFGTAYPTKNYMKYQIIINIFKGLRKDTLQYKELKSILVDKTKEITEPTLIKYLNILAEKGQLSKTEKGRETWYHLNF